MTRFQESQLTSLPDEVIQSILEYSTPFSAINFGAVSRRFRHVTNEPLLWRHFCLVKYNSQSPDHQLQQKLASKEAVDWKALYVERFKIDRQVRQTLDSIISSQTDRNTKVESIAQNGLNAKHALLQSLATARQSPDFLARQYWSHAILSSIQREYAINTWSALDRSPHDLKNLEKWFGVFDIFIRGGSSTDLNNISELLDKISDDIAKENPIILEQSHRQRALIIAEFLRRHELVGIHSDRPYHSLANNFIGIALSNADHSSLPLISVVIYCSICVRFGLDAQPCSFPYHVHAIISPPSNQDLDGKPTANNDPMYMDPWRSAEEVPVSSLHEQLNLIPNFNSHQPRMVFLSETQPPSLVLRCARNILHSIQEHSAQGHATSEPRISLISARYAALWASVILSAPSSSSGSWFLEASSNYVNLHNDLVNLLHVFASEFSHDFHLIEKHIFPIIERFGDRFRSYITRIREMQRLEARPKTIKRRSNYPPDHILYRVGQVFRHVRYGYRAVIIGWDARCDAREEWIATMGVDNLNGGREQSFYNALVLDDLSTRYVASENIFIMTPDETEEVMPASFSPQDDDDETNSSSLFPIPEAGDFELEVGRYFKRWDRDAGTFVSNMTEEYPED